MLKNIAAKIALIYFIAATAWILLTDRLVELLIDNVRIITLFQTFKGMIFVLLTTVGLFFIIKMYVGRLEKTTAELEKSEDELRNINENLSNLVQEETQKRLEGEKAILSQSKLVLMGEMLGAISHHWRQPLNAVGIKIQDVYYAYKNNEINEAYITNFTDSSMSIVKEMSKMIDDFRNFFSPSENKEEFAVEDAIDDTLRLLSAKLANGMIETVIAYDNPQNRRYFGFKQELQQVILNILSNASDAIIDSNDGNLKRFIKIETSYSENRAKITIEDSGGGIDESIRDRIYDPYFSTKEQGRGVGIGLYMSKEMIERQMGGKLHDEKGELRAKFIIELPLV